MLLRLLLTFIISIALTACSFEESQDENTLFSGGGSSPNNPADVTAPSLSSFSTPADNMYIYNQSLNFTLTFDEAVVVIGSPRIALTIDGTTKYATYNSGTFSSTLIFSYQVEAGLEDLNGVDFVGTAIDMNGGAIGDAASNALSSTQLDSVGAMPDLSNIFVDSIIPTTTIVGATNITAANELTYTLSGSCSENGRTVSINIASIAVNPTCLAGAWTTGAVDVSSLSDSGSITITADHSDSNGNNAIQASATVSKDTITALVDINSPTAISQANHTAWELTGTCTTNGVLVDINIGAINVQPNCSSGIWTTGLIDVSSLSDNASIAITADHSTATQATANVAKDTTAPTVTISSAVNISLGNEANYSTSGTCSENGRTVTVNVGTLSFTPTCNSGSWTTGFFDASSLNEGSISITADHDNASSVAATQATANISKNTATPSVSSLTAPTTLTNSIDLNWNMNNPGAFTIDDYEINYKVKGTSTWLNFADGVDTDTSGTVTGLLASTIYEFRVRVLYDSSQVSDWSNTAEGETKPDDPLFSSPNVAMNVGGATSSAITTYYDNTRVYINSVEIPESPLSAGQVVIKTTAQFDVIDADKPVFTAGILGTGSGGSGANMVWMPTSWAGKSFSFNSTRSNPQNLWVYATENATVTLKQGSTVLASAVLTAGSGTTLNWSVYGSYQVTSTGTILAFHMSGSGSTRHDPKPILPGHTEIIGFPSSSMRLTTNIDGTNYNYIHSNDSVAAGGLSKSGVVTISPQGTSSLYRSESLLIQADQKIAGASFADSNGLCAAPFLPTNLMKTKYVINATSDYVAFASKVTGTIDVYAPGDQIGVDAPTQTVTLTKVGTDPNAPYKYRFGTVTAGTRFVSTVPMAGWYHPSVEAGSAIRDETVLYGTDD